MIGVALLHLIIYIVMTTSHKKKLKEEAVYLTMPGELVKVNGHDLHVMQGGEDDSENTLVFLHTSKAVDDCVALEPLFGKLDNCEYIYIDRSGYGYSPVSESDRSAETIVEEYRAALKLVGEEAPYTLVSMGTSGVYAFEWAKLYPEEVERIIGVNMNYPEQFADVSQEQYCSFLDYLMVGFCDMGGHRLLKSIFPSDGFGVYTAEQMKERKAIFAKMAYNQDIFNEDSVTLAEAKKVSDMGFPEDTEMYLIYANPLMEPYLSADSYVKEEYDKAVKENSEVDYQLEYNRSVREYFQSYKNVKVVEMSGPDKLYLYNPTELGKLINEYID